jgi:hypothetical protein
MGRINIDLQYPFSMLRNQLPLAAGVVMDMIRSSRLLWRTGLLFVAAIAWLGGFSMPVAFAVDNIVYQDDKGPASIVLVKLFTLTRLFCVYSAER